MRYILNIGLKNFRCFAEAPSITLNHLTVLAGPNNSGKSAFLAAIRRLVSIEMRRHAPHANPAGMSFMGPTTLLGLESTDQRDSATSTIVELTIGTDVSTRRIGDAEIERANLPARLAAEFVSGPARKVVLLDNNSKPSNDHSEHDAAAMSALRLLARLPIVFVPERRRLPSLHEVNDNAVRVREDIVEPVQLPEYLLALFCESPNLFESWELLVSEMIGAETRVQLRPRTDHKIEVSIAGEQFRSLQDVGCGIVEVMNIAQIFARYDGGLLLFEEPELHLHASIQRRVINTIERYCVTGQWQSLITTHSNHILDSGSDNVATYSVENGDSGSALISVTSRLQGFRLLDALGVRPSSVLQANAVIWVEGPSDAVYLRYFLNQRMRQAGQELREFTSFGFAFFGGALLRHTSVAIAPIPELVDLLSVHPKSFVVLDSDRISPNADLGKEYTRDFLATAPPGRTWVSAGREIENYLVDEVLIWAVTDSFGSYASHKALVGIDRSHGVFSEQAKTLRDALGLQRAAHDTSEGAKTAFARSAVHMMGGSTQIDWLRQLDLKDRLDELIGFILRANELHNSCLHLPAFPAVK